MPSTRDILEVLLGDIIKVNADAIVNAANSDLARGAGVCGAIFAAAGPELEEECRRKGRCRTGGAVVTGAYKMANAKWIIHSVGPIYRGPESAEILADTYRAIIERCHEIGARSVGIPCISTGIYRYPQQEAAQIAVNTLSQFADRASGLARTIFCCFSHADYEIYSRLLRS